MPSLNIEQFGDLLKTTLSHFETPDYTSLVTDLTDHPAAKQLVKRSSMKIGSGKSAVWKVKMQTGNAAANVAITDHDNVNIVDGFQDAEVQWRKSKTSYAFYEEEMAINRSPARLVDLIKSREDGALVDWIELLESNFWNFPSAADTVTPFGLPYWCVKNATEGFNGGIPSGYSSVAGISPTTYPRWNNYTAQYTSISLDDMIKKARTMAEQTAFKPPVASVPDIGGYTGDGMGSSRAYYTNLSVKQTFEDVADSRNENLGVDVAKNDNMAMFRRAPINYVPLLNRDTTNPFYQMNWDVFKILVLSGFWQKRTVLAPYPGQRNVSAVFLDSVYQIVAFNRRLLGVLATGTSYPS